MVSCSIIILSLLLSGFLVHIYEYSVISITIITDSLFSFTYPRSIAQIGMDTRESRVDITMHLVANL